MAGLLFRVLTRLLLWSGPVCAGCRAAGCAAGSPGGLKSGAVGDGALSHAVLELGDTAASGVRRVCSTVATVGRLLRNEAALPVRLERLRAGPGTAGRRRCATACGSPDGPRGAPHCCPHSGRQLTGGRDRRIRSGARGPGPNATCKLPDTHPRHPRGRCGQAARRRRSVRTDRRRVLRRPHSRPDWLTQTLPRGSGRDALDLRLVPLRPPRLPAVDGRRAAPGRFHPSASFMPMRSTPAEHPGAQHAAGAAEAEARAGRTAPETSLSPWAVAGGDLDSEFRIGLGVPDAWFAWDTSGSCGASWVGVCRKRCRQSWGATLRA